MLVVLCAACAPAQVITEKPLGTANLAQVSLAPGVEVWEVAGSRDGISISDYVSLESPFWLRPGRFKVAFGCPGLEHTYSNTAVVVVPAPGRFTFSCAAGGKLVLSRVRP
jgi:hypothetical protein